MKSQLNSLLLALGTLAFASSASAESLQVRVNIANEKNLVCEVLTVQDDYKNTNCKPDGECDGLYTWKANLKCDGGLVLQSLHQERTSQSGVSRVERLVGNLNTYDQLTAEELRICSLVASNTIFGRPNCARSPNLKSVCTNQAMITQEHNAPTNVRVCVEAL